MYFPILMNIGQQICHLVSWFMITGSHEVKGQVLHSNFRGKLVNSIDVFMNLAQNIYCNYIWPQFENRKVGSFPYMVIVNEHCLLPSFVILEWVLYLSTLNTPASRDLILILRLTLFLTNSYSDNSNSLLTQKMTNLLNINTAFYKAHNNCINVICEHSQHNHID